MLGFGNTAVSILIGHMGNRVCGRLCDHRRRRGAFSTVFTAGLGQAAHAVTGNTVGAGRRQQAYQEALTMLFIAFLLGIGAAVIMQTEWSLDYFRVSD